RSLIGSALRVNPRCRIFVPFVAGIRDGAKRCLDFVPTSALVEGTTEGFGDECTPLTSPDPGIQVCDDLVVEANVQSHGHTIAHAGSPYGVSLPSSTPRDPRISRGPRICGGG